MLKRGIESLDGLHERYLEAGDEKPLGWFARHALVLSASRSLMFVLDLCEALDVTEEERNALAEAALDDARDTSEQWLWRRSALLRISLQRAYLPSEAQTEVSCAICGERFELGVVYAWIHTSGGPHELCERCLMRFIEWQHMEGLPTEWPTLEQYFEARWRYKTPYFASREEYEKAIEEGHGDDHYEECYLT